MSHNQSRTERSDSAQYRKTGRSGNFNQQRNFSGGPSGKGGGGASAAASNSSNRSFNKKHNSNAQGGHSSARSANASSEPSNSSAARDAENGAHQQQPTPRMSDSAVTNTSSSLKPADYLDQRTTVSGPGAPPSNIPSAAQASSVSTASSKSKGTTTPAKGDASKSFSLQFGSISPGVVDGMQIPPRTSSAPPNMDEQKKAQARHESFRAAPAMPASSIPEQHFLKKDAGILDQPNAGESLPASKSNRDVQFSATSPVNQTQKPSMHPVPGMYTQLPFHLLQVPVQFGAPNSQFQSQAMSGAPLPMPIPIPLPLRNPPMQQKMFVSGVPPHPMQSQGMMHQGHTLNFSSQMGPLPPHLGNMGMNMAPQFPQQQGGKYSGSRKTVKITHPETREELRLDGSPGPKSHSNLPPQSQPIPSFPPNHPMSFYPNFFPPASSIPLTGTQVASTSQAPRLKQVTVKPAVYSHSEKEPLPPKSSASVGKAESSKPLRLQGEDLVQPRKVIDPSSPSSLPQGKPGSGAAPISDTPSDRVNVDNDVRNNLNFASAPVDSYASISNSTVGKRINEVVVPDSTKDKHNRLGSRGQQDQVDRQSTSQSSLPSQLPKNEAVEEKSSSSSTNLVLDSAEESLSTTVPAASAVVVSNLSTEGPKAKSLDTHYVSRSPSNPETMGRKEQGEAISFESLKADQHGLETSLMSLSLENPEIIAKIESSDQEVTPSTSESALKPANGDIDNNSSSTASRVKDKVLADTNMAKIAVPKGKKKKKELYRKTEAAVPSSDLYMAYKGPEEKKEEVAGNTSTSRTEQISTEVPQDNTIPSEKPSQIKVESDDWEDAAEISNSQLKTLKNEKEVIDGDENGSMTKRYSRDFLLKFVEQCTELPEGFEISSDIGDSLMVSRFSNSRESYPSPGRHIDRPIGNYRPDRRGIGMGDEEKWMKFPGPHTTGRGDMWPDVGYLGNVGFRPAEGGNYGALRNPRAQTPVPYVGGILSGPMQSLGPQGGLQRNNSDSDRWQRGTGFQKGLMPYPHAPPQMMHRAEKKYEVGKVSDEEEAKQRQLKGILNKLTPQNFEKLFQQVKEVNIDNLITLSGVISQIFDKALMEPTFCEMYANFCFHLAADLPDLSVDDEKITFKRLLLNKCQEEFEREEREEEEANEANVEGENEQTPEEREEKRLKTRRRMLGNIRLIGELYKKRMLIERIMHGCINKLLGQYQNPDEENIEALCKLMSTIGEMIDHPKAKEYMDAYFDIMARLSNNMKLSSRVRFMLKDAIDLRKNKWQERRKVEGPKKIEEVHRDAAQERQAQSSRLARAPGIGSSARRPPQMEFSHRALSLFPSSSSQIGGYRAVSPQGRGYGSQDARVEERRSFENRTMSVPLPQRPLGDDSITLGPQGGLARGMAFRGQPSAPNISSGEMPSPGDARMMAHGRNGFSSMPEQMAYGQRDDVVPRYVPDRFAAPSIYEQSNPLGRGITHGNKDVRNTDLSFDRSVSTSPPARAGHQTSIENVSSQKVWPEERLRDKSMAAIKEFYSARDEKEVALCIKDLHARSFYPSMISIWVTDSFERKDMERDLLTKLLINLSKPRDAMISEDQLIKGFESVLSVLEDAVNDAPRASEFLGRMFARVILENIVSLSEIGRLIYEGGEEQGRLVETGLAAEVLGSILDIIKIEKGDSVLNDIRLISNLRLENFRPPGSNKSLTIDKYI